MENIDSIVAASMEITGWRRAEEGLQIAKASMALSENPTIVEVGVFMGRSTVQLAGPCRLKGGGTVHCVDPFDCSGDAFSIPHYVSLLEESGSNSLEQVFRENIARLGLESWIQVHKGQANEIAEHWSFPVDLLLLDGDQSVAGARVAYDSWVPFLKRGGTIIIGNSQDCRHAVGHEGNRRLVELELVEPKFLNINQYRSTAIAIKA